MAAFLLQHAGAMRSLLAASLILVAAPAWAAGTGSCTGMGIMGTIGLAKPNGSMDSIQMDSVPFAFNGAECQCAGNPNGDQPLLLQIQLTQAFPQGTTGTAQIWYGLNCDTDNLGRTSSVSTSCEIGDSTAVTFSTFVQGSSSTYIYIPIENAKLFAPKTHVCPAGQTSNGIYILFFTGSSSNLSGSPYATCSLVQTELLQGPGAPTGLNASSGDGAVTLNWSAPNATAAQPQYYQVLCADDAGNPVRSSPPANIYSTCTPDGLQRRDLPTGGSLPAGTDDAGTGTASAPFDTASAPGGGPPAPEPRASGDGGVLTDADGGVIGSGLQAPFTFLDRKFVCSDPIPLGTGGGTVRISGLTNSKAYKFVVVGVDQYGNPTPNDNGIITATPQPVEDLYRRYRDAGGGGSGFCFIATAAYGSYEHRYVRILRQFRDEVLLPTSFGSSFVDWYYVHSPGAAAYIADHAAARSLTRVALWPVIGFAAGWLYVPGWLKLLLLLSFVAWLVQRRRRRLARTA